MDMCGFYIKATAVEKRIQYLPCKKVLVDNCPSVDYDIGEVRGLA